MGQVVIGVGEMGTCNTEGGELKTFALGSCVAVLIYDLATKHAGMVHVALPHSTTNKKRAESLPGYFADLGIPILLDRVNKERGATGGKGLVVKLVGGANVMKDVNMFNIGERNIEAARKELGTLKLAPVAEDVGGAISRTVTLDVDTGRVLLQSPGRSDWGL